MEHHNDLNEYASSLKCGFCRNTLNGQDVNQTPFQDSDVMFSVMCDTCQANYKEKPDNFAPKFLICCCSETPRELDTDMGKEEIQTLLAETHTKHHTESDDEEEA